MSYEYYTKYIKNAYVQGDAQMQVNYKTGAIRVKVDFAIQNNGARASYSLKLCDPKPGSTIDEIIKDFISMSFHEVVVHVFGITSIDAELMK